jgi:hypothetical protein
MRDRRRQRVAVALIVLALHALLLLAWLGTIVRQRSAPDPARVSVRLLPLAPARVEPPVSPDVPSAHPPVAATARAPTRPRPAARTTVEPPGQSTVQAEAPISSAEAASAPSQPSPDANLLDTEASRRAIHSAAGNPNLATRIDEQVGVRSPTDAQRLPGNIQQAGKGDCLKTGYPGAGMGLLSLPFFAAAIATGNCAR